MVHSASPTAPASPNCSALKKLRLCVVRAAWKPAGSCAVTVMSPMILVMSWSVVVVVAVVLVVLVELVVMVEAVAVDEVTVEVLVVMVVVDVGVVLVVIEVVDVVDVAVVDVAVVIVVVVVVEVVVVTVKVVKVLVVTVDDIVDVVIVLVSEVVVLDIVVVVVVVKQFSLIPPRTKAVAFGVVLPSSMFQRGVPDVDVAWSVRKPASAQNNLSFVASTSKPMGRLICAVVDSTVMSLSVAPEFTSMPSRET